MSSVRRLGAKATEYAATLAAYARESRSPRDLVRLMRVRLSQSKIGPAVCPRPVEVDVAMRRLGRGVRLRSHTTDISVLGELILGDSYEPLARAAPADVGTIVDLGANTGLAARWLLERFPKARLVAVEPHEGNLAVLRRNLAPYGNRAVVIGACIGATERSVELVGTREDGYSMREPVAGGGTTPVITMDRIFEELESQRIDVLKVDIEGAEQELFAPSAEWVDRVGVLSVECHHPFTAAALVERIAAGGVRPDVVSAETSAFGYDTVVVRIR